MRLHYFLLFLFISCSVFISCSSPKALEYRDFKNLKINKLGFNTSNVSLDMGFYNPNNFGMQLKRADLDIYIENNLVGHATEIYQIKIPRKDTFSLPVQVDVDMKNIFRNAFTSLLKQQLHIKVSGTMKVGKAKIFVTFPVYYEGYQPFKFSN